MTSFANSVIITHEVFHVGVDADKGYNMVSSGWLNDAFEYYEGKGEHLEKEVDRSLTAADKELEQLKYLEGINAIVDYGTRSGRFADRNPDLPMAAGEKSGGVWDLRGVCDPEEIKNRILATQTNVMRTVITVPREWADTLHLTTKADWQALIRSTWPEFVDKWDLIPRQHQDFCAFFHTDNKVNIHCHVLTWDKSGYYFTGEARIPQDRIEPSKEVVRKAVFKSFSLERSLLKNFVREASILKTKQALGVSITEEERARVNVLARKAGINFETESPVMSDRKIIDALLQRASDGLPAAGIGRVGYGSASADARVASNLALIEIRKDPAVAELRDTWKKAVERGADILGKHGWERSEYITKETQNLDRRCANIVLKKAAELNQPWIKDANIAASRENLLSSDKCKAPLFVVRRAAGELMQEGVVAQKTIYWAGHQAMKDAGLLSAASAYRSSIVSYVQTQSKKPLTTEQIDRLCKRVDSDIVRSIGEKVTKDALRYSLDTLRFQDSRLIRSTLFATRAAQHPSRYQSTILSNEDKRSINKDLDLVKKDIRHHRPLNQEALDRIARNILDKPEIKASIAKAVKLASLTPHADQKETSKQEFLQRYERIQDQVIEIASREAAYDKEAEAAQREQAIESLVKSALQSQGEVDAVKQALIVKLKDYSKHIDKKLEAQAEISQRR